MLHFMREIFGQITIAVTVVILATVKVCIAVITNVLALHARMLTGPLLPAFVTPEVAVLIVAIAYLLIAFIAIMIRCILVRAIDDSVATITIVIFVFVYVIANEFSVTFITLSVVIIVVAPSGTPYAAPITNVITVIILMVSVIRIFLALGFLATYVTDRVFIIVDMVIASKLFTTFVAIPVAIVICANIGHPASALITEVIAILIYMILAKLLHTVRRAITIITSSVIIPVAAIVAQPKIAIIAEVVVVAIFVQNIVFLIAPLEIFLTSVAQSVLVFIHVLFARNLIFANVTPAVAVLVYTGDAIPAYIAMAVIVFVCTHIVESSTADSTFV